MQCPALGREDGADIQHSRAAIRCCLHGTVGAAPKARRCTRTQLPPPEDHCARHGFEREPDIGEQEGGAYNGHFGCICYPLFVFNQFGDGERCALRPGNVRSAEGWRAVLEPVIARYRGTGKRLYSGATRPLPIPRFTSSAKARASATRSGSRPIASCRKGSDTCSSARSGDRRTRCAVTMPASPIGRRAGTSLRAWWPRSSGISASFTRVGFIVTNLPRSAERVVAFYNQRGTAEQWIKEGKGAIKWMRLSCRPFAANAVRLQLHALAYNLGNFMRTLAMPKAAEPWSRTRLREKLIKIGAKVVSHGSTSPSKWPRSQCRGRCSMKSSR